MRFLANENWPGDAVSALGSSCHEVAWVRTEAPGSSDESILARALHIAGTRVGAIVNERRPITAGTALRRGRYFGTGAELWINVQAHYELEVARDRLDARINREVQPRKVA